MTRIISKPSNSMKIYRTSLYTLILLLVPWTVNVESIDGVDIYWAMVQ
ncbi:hypothetical protein SAMN04488010_3057 [Maribacter stanieri]|uniref:Uncharacterized protein n=1 Tax=Maribacter stanieri TaxID=440514 RepID=A0A1I6JVM3_9FLAO|nr:hypothetical protein SAMN04488010_3057 [Maribacter stanieri]